MSKLNPLGWLALGLVLFAAGCVAPGDGSPATTIARELPTATRVIQTQAPATPEAEVPVETPQAPGRPVETPTAGVVLKPTEAEADPTQTPGVIAGPQSEAISPVEPAAGPGPSEAQRKLLADLKSYGAAPELYNEVWLNSAPLKLADLRGKVVIVQFWTFG